MSKSMHKFSKGGRSPPMRKDLMMKKPMIASSMHIPSSRTQMMKHLPPDMKRIPVLNSSKTMHSSKMRSIASTSYRPMSHRIQRSSSPDEREHCLKRPKYEMRKISPPRHSVTPPGHPGRPYSGERYMGEKVMSHDPRFSPPPKKRLTREPDRFQRDTSPMQRMTSPMPGRPVHHPNTMARNSSVNVGMTSSVGNRSSFASTSRGRGGPAAPAPPKPAYINDGYPSATSSKDKHFPTTLNERFSSVVEAHRTEPRVKYTQEDLEKITIDIRRNIKPPSPTVRHIVNPNDVKLVRRSNEGHRPMFDRDEIKQASRDLREDAYYEKKAAPPAQFVVQHRVENYEITRHRIDTRRMPENSSRSLNDRWRNADGDSGPKAEAWRNSDVHPGSVRKDVRGFERPPIKKSFGGDARSKSGDQDFRSERYSNQKQSLARPDYKVPRHSFSPSRHSPSPPMLMRGGMRKEGGHTVSRQRMGGRQHLRSVSPDGRDNYHPGPSKRYMEDGPPRNSKHYGRRHSPDMGPPKWAHQDRSRSRERSVPSYSQNPDKYGGKPWLEKHDASPRDPNYFHSGYDSSYRGRGGSRPFRSPRGGFRGSRGFSSRGSFRGSRGRGAMRSY